MNKQRRKELCALIKKLQKATNKDDLKDCIRILDAIKSDEELAYDNRPEGLQDSLQGSESQEAIECMEEALGYLEEAQNEEFEDNIEYAISCLEDALM